jgi:hypothetical protein
MYYNSNTNAIRSCIGGQWDDLASTAGLGILLFGVMPDSGSNPGDSQGITGAGNGPCKVSWNTGTSVNIAPCTAYSGGRKVIVPATTLSSITTTNGNYIHVCLNGSGGQPVYSTSGAQTADLPTFSVTAPIECLADIKTSDTAITNIYDTRVFTNTPKMFTTASTADTAGMIVDWDKTTTGNVVYNVTSANTPDIQGVIVASSGSGSTSTINAIIVQSGLQWVKAIASLGNNYVSTSSTAGYASAPSSIASGFDTNAGEDMTANGTGTCSSAANCEYSILVSLNIESH